MYSAMKQHIQCLFAGVRKWGTGGLMSMSLILYCVLQIMCQSASMDCYEEEKSSEAALTDGCWGTGPLCPIKGSM